MPPSSHKKNVNNSSQKNQLPEGESSLSSQYEIVKKTPQESHYQLHIPAAHAPADIHKNTPKPAQKSPQDAIKDALKKFNGWQKIGKPKEEKSEEQYDPDFKTKFWRFLEWFATSALIFVILFFAVNFSSYADLIMLKLDRLRGEYSLSPFIEKMLQPSADSSTQELLPVVKSQDQMKKQIPPIAIDIAPPDDRIIIPGINKNVPIVNVKTENLIKRDWGALEKDIQESLQNGVVHYPGTAYPGMNGNVVITGHSSYFVWDPGRFKDVFALLHEVSVGDKIIIYYQQKKYIYQVYEKTIVTPDKVDILTQDGTNKLTLITCTPIGTNLKRLVLIAKPVDQ
ncbi:class D sortase [Candidatus Peregrinibacteria bacterium]|nr:class D sortase [Candidatus Peregrinibacteria bacterium]